jgi:co-chaperonin GroES (HSP10)
MHSYGENIILKPQPLSDKRASGVISATHSEHSRLIRQVYPYLGKVIEIPKNIQSKVECKKGDNVVYLRWGSFDVGKNLLSVDFSSIIARAN